MADFASRFRKAVPTASSALLKTLTQPLRPTELLRTAALLFAITTFYCQIYCTVAFQLVARMPMPIEASAAWAFGVVVPWLACFELCKRRRELAATAAWRALLVLLIFAGSGFLSIVLELGLDQLLGVGATRPLPLQVAAQLPMVLLTGGLLIIAGFLREQIIDAEPANGSDNIEALLARAADIEWIEAAGNYVEVHGGGRVTLHRVTMRQLEGSLDPARFTRIHRSVIVNTAEVDCRQHSPGGPVVRLKSGKTFRLGRRYGSALPSGAH